MKMVRSGRRASRALVELLLGIHLLGDALDDEVGVLAAFLHRLGGRDPGQDARHRALGQQAVLDEGREVGLGDPHGLLEVSALREYMLTSYPAVANTCARPGPMVPAPKMATFLTSATFTRVLPWLVRYSGKIVAVVV